MYCKNCGNNVQEGLNNCPFCGTSLKQPQPSMSNTQTEIVHDSYQQMPGYVPNTTGIMVMGIVAACIAWFPLGSIAAIILGAIAVSKVNAYVAAGYPGSGKIKAGSITGKVGIIAGAIMTGIYMLYFMAACIAIL